MRQEDVALYVALYQRLALYDLEEHLPALSQLIFAARSKSRERERERERMAHIGTPRLKSSPEFHLVEFCSSGETNCKGFARVPPTPFQEESYCGWVTWSLSLGPMLK